MFLDAFVADKLIFNTFYEIYLGNYAFKQNDESLAAHRLSNTDLAFLTFATTNFISSKISYKIGKVANASSLDFKQSYLSRFEKNDLGSKNMSDNFLSLPPNNNNNGSNDDNKNIYNNSGSNNDNTKNNNNNVNTINNNNNNMNINSKNSNAKTNNDTKINSSTSINNTNSNDNTTTTKSNSSN